jgi:hypothetical protein
MVYRLFASFDNLVLSRDSDRMRCEKGKSPSNDCRYLVVFERMESIDRADAVRNKSMRAWNEEH